MAFMTLIMTVSMVAIASAGFPGWRDNYNPFPGFHSPMMTALRFGPIASPPSMYGMPTFPQTYPFFPFPVFPAMPAFPPMPSVADIATVVPPKGGSFSGVVISSKSHMKRKDDGTIVKEGGSTILTNTDGVISMKQTGNNPPPLPTNAPTFDFNDPKINPNHKNFGHFKKMEDFNKFDFHHTLAIDPKKIESYVPGKNERFEGHSVSTHTFSSNKNGQVKEGGSLTKIENNNGRIKKEKVAFNSDGTQP